jgi:CHAT domain-containing protein/predicted negative regulator of RcsB-dependent stress response
MLGRFFSLCIFLVSLVGFGQEISLYRQVSLLHDQEDFQGIVKMENALLTIVNGRSDTVAANVYFYLADGNLKAGSLEKSIQYFELARQLRQPLLPAEPEEYSFILFNLTHAYFEANDLEKGKETGQLLVDFDQRAFGMESEQYLNSLFKYVDILINAMEISVAESKLELAIRQSKPFTHQAGELLSKLAEVCSYAGKYSKAERLFQESLELLQVTDGSDSEIYNITLSNYASLLTQQARYDQAEEYLTQVLETARDKEWFTNETRYASLNNLGLVYQSLGQYESSEKVFYELLRLDSATIGIDHSDFAVTLSNLGLLYNDEEKFSEAENVLNRSIAILQRNNATRTVSYAAKLNNMAKVYINMSRYDEAIKLLKQVLGIVEKQFGKQSPHYATVLSNLGTVYMATNSPKALSTLRSALAIREKTLGKSHPLYGESKERIAQYYWKRKQWKEAGTAYRETFENYFAQIENYFPVLTEEEKSNFFYQKVKPTLEAYAFFTAKDPSNTGSIAQLYDYHINTKGLILHATEKVRKSVLSSTDQELIALYEQWENVKDVLTYYYSIHEAQSKIDSLLQQSRELEKQLTRRSEDFARNIIRSKVSWKEIQGRLQPGEAVLECIRYRVYHPDSGRFIQQVHYAFLLLTAETKTAPRLIVLQHGQEMEGRYLNYYRNGIRLKLDDLYTFKNYWAPLQDELQRFAIHKVYFSPDGVYNLINPGTIRNPFTERYLMEELDFRLITSSRSLVEEKSSDDGLKTGYLFGYPTYNVASFTDQPIRTMTATRSFRGGMLRFLRDGKGITELPGTRLEVEQIAYQLKSAYKSVDVRIEINAVEPTIKTVDRPTLLHIATHGYFLEDKESMMEYGSNPLLMSGLILAGAENFIRTGHNPLHNNDDGILTAFEAMNLNLTGTKLVVLSACETGLGKIHPGEGVYGLQRAFQVAGAEAIIMSLWNVDDVATQLLMGNFYEQYIKSQDLYDAFYRAQKLLKEQYPEPFYWGAFILVGKGN